MGAERTPNRNGAGPDRAWLFVGRAVIVRRRMARLDRRLVDRQTQNRRRLELQPVGRPDLVPAPGQQRVGERLERGQPRRGALDAFKPAEQHDRVVVRGVLKRRAGEHQPVEDRHREARGSARCQAADHPAGGRAMDEHVVADPGVEGRDAVRLVRAGERDVRHAVAVEHPVDRFTVIAGALRRAPDPHAGLHPDAHGAQSAGPGCGR